MNYKWIGWVCCAWFLVMIQAIQIWASPFQVNQPSQEEKLKQATAVFEEGKQLAGKQSAEGYTAALEKLTLARQLFQELGEVKSEGLTLTWIGFVYSSTGQKKTAITYYLESVPLFEKVDDKKNLATALNNLGLAYSALGEHPKALEFLTRALPMLQELELQKEVATTLNNLGTVYNQLGQQTKALELYQQSLPIFRTIGDQKGEAFTLNNIGVIFQQTGELKKALDYFLQALPLRRSSGDRRGEAATLSNLGLTYNYLGQFWKSLDHYTQALVLMKAIGDRRSEATVLVNQAQAYSVLGNTEKSLESLLDALALFQKLGDRSLEAVTFNNIGVAYVIQGKLQKALEQYEQALQLRQQVGDKDGAASTLNNIGDVHLSLGDYQKALDYYFKALSLKRETGDQRGIASAYAGIGYAWFMLDEPSKAVEYLRQALAIFEKAGDRRRTANLLCDLGQAEWKLGNFAQAQSNFERGLSFIESVRFEIKNTDLQATYLATQQDIYSRYLTFLLDSHIKDPAAGHQSAAFEVSERRRTRNFLDLLAEAHINVHQGVNPALIEEERRLQQKISLIGQKRARLFINPGTEPQQKALAAQFDELEAELQAIQIRIKESSPHYADLIQPKPITMKRLQTELLDPETVLLEYTLGKHYSFLWVVTPTEVNVYWLPKRELIEQVTQKFVELISGQKASTPEEVEAASRRLSDLILAPVADRLGTKRLLIVPDGILFYVPFAALTRQKSSAAETKGPARSAQKTQASQFIPLIVDHEIVVLPSASVLALLRQQTSDRKPAPKILAVLADPVFDPDDPRLSHQERESQSQRVHPSAGIDELKGPEGNTNPGLAPETRFKLTRLKNAQKEAEAILAFVPPAKRTLLTGFAVNRELITNPDLTQYRFLHFATHGFVNPERPELSGIALSLLDKTGQEQPGFLLTSDIFNLNLPVELVVLSACETGLGKLVKGEGMIGLTRGFMYAGARRVVSSLWKVSDIATAQLMTELYRGIFVKRLPPAAALRQAQLVLWKQNRWKSPFNWAGFVLHGEYR